METNLKKFRINSSIDRAVATAGYVSEDVARFYFSKLREYKTDRLLSGQVPPVAKNRRAEVVSLPYVADRNARLLAINARLESEWTRICLGEALDKPGEQDTRVPTFIVIDEAHNVIRADPRNRLEITVGEQFRTVAAEGRKYGLFLILVSQRPDKLDPLIVSECENKALMRLDSNAVLDRTSNLLGLQEVPSKLLAKCLEFGIGRALLVGRWAAGGPTPMYCAARRTIAGGRNLRGDHWAVPDAPPEPPTSPPSDSGPAEPEAPPSGG